MTEKLVDENIPYRFESGIRTPNVPVQNLQQVDGPFRVVLDRKLRHQIAHESQLLAIEFLNQSFQ